MGIIICPPNNYFAVTTIENDHIITGTGIGIVYSHDSGATWHQSTSLQHLVDCLITGPDNTIYAGTTNGIMYSVDNGVTWVQSGLHGFNIISFTSDDDGNIYAVPNYRGVGIYRSNNSGLTWEQLRTGLEGERVTAIAVDTAGNIFTGTFEGWLFYNSVNVDTFRLINPQNPVGLVNCMKINQENELIIGSEQGGIFHLTSPSMDLTPLNSGLISTSVHPLGSDNTGFLLAANEFNGIYRSLDLGQSWFPVEPRLGGSHLYTFLNDFDRLLLGTTIEITYAGYLWQSLDGGLSWENFQDGIPLVDPGLPWIQPVLDMDHDSQGNTFAVLFTDGVYHLPAGSSTWEAIGMSLPDSNISSLCVDSNDDIYIGFRYGNILKSIDNGQTWESSLIGWEDYDVHLLDSHGDIVYALLSNQISADSTIGLYSTDYGQSWMTLHTETIGNHVNSLTIDDEGNIYVGTYSAGVFSSNNDGQVWQAFNQGLSDHHISGIFYDPRGFLICGTTTEGLFKYNLSFNSTEEYVSIPQQLILHRNYPNPFNPITTIQYELRQRSDVKITVYDILGRKVATLVSDTQDAGYKSVIWDGNNEYGRSVGTGIYLYQIKAGDFTQTRKMLLLK